MNYSFSELLHFEMAFTFQGCFFLFIVIIIVFPIFIVIVITRNIFDDSTYGKWGLARSFRNSFLKSKCAVKFLEKEQNL